MTRPAVHPELEEMAPVAIVSHEIQMDEKEEVLHVEDKIADDEGDPNSPEAILERYPLLRGKSEKELDTLNRRLRRRIDLRMLPILTICLMINYLDRSNVTNARIAGMQKDMKMNDVQWSTGITTFYVGYIVSQLPGALLVSKYKPRISIPIMMVGWSIPTILFPFVRSPAAFAGSRFAVGFAEGPFLAVVALMTSSWYVKEELPFRMAVWHGSQALSNVIGGPMAAAVLENMNGIKGMHAWEWFMIIEGAMSIVAAIAAGILLPNWADNTPWLTPEETEMAQYRIVMSAGGMDEADNGITIWKGAKMAMGDWITWLFTLLHLFLISAQSFKDFLPSILQTLSHSSLETYLLQTPAYFLGYIAILVLGWTSGRYRESGWHIIGPMIVSAAGTGMLIATKNLGVRYSGICLLIMGVFSGLNIQISWSAQLIPSPRHKKAAMFAIANAIGEASHWVSPFFFLTNQKPLYRMGGGFVLVSILLTILTVFGIQWYVRRLNRALDAKEAAANEERRERGLEALPQGWRFSK